MKDVPLEKIFSRAWEGTRNNWPMLLALCALYLAVSIITNLAENGVGIGSLLSAMVGFLLNILFYLLVMKFTLRVAEQGGAKVELFSEMELDAGDMLRFFLTNIVMTLLLCLVAGLCMLPVLLLALVTVGVSLFSPHSEVWRTLLGPGLICLGLAAGVTFYFALALSQTLYVCIHQGLGPIDSLYESWRLTEGAKGGLFLLWLATLAIIFGGILCLLVGIIPAFMVVVMAQPFVYLSLLEQSAPPAKVAAP